MNVKYRNIQISHLTEDIELIQSIVKDFSPELIIEFGTWLGGLTLALNDALPEATIYTYDHNNYFSDEMEQFINDTPNIHFIRTDVLNLDEPIEILTRKEKKFFYCDNGNKVHELLKYALTLNTGDMLGVHDWGTEIYSEHSRLNDVWIKKITPLEIDILNYTLSKNFQEFDEGKMCKFWIKR